MLARTPCKDRAQQEQVPLLDADKEISGDVGVSQNGVPRVSLCYHHPLVYKAHAAARGCRCAAKFERNGVQLCGRHFGGETPERMVR